MAAEPSGGIGRIGSVLRPVLLGGVLLFCSIGALAGGAATKPTAEAFPFGEQLADVYHALRLRAGSDTIGTVYVTEERLIRYHKSYDLTVAESFAAEVNAYAAEQTVPVYWMAVPTAAGLYSETLPQGAPQANEQALLNTVSGMLESSITQIDVYSWLYSMRDAYIYYRTDRHWTTYGAFCAYKTAIRKMGFANLGYDRFIIEHITADFQGSFVQETGYADIRPDVVDIYRCDNGTTYTAITAVDANGKQTELQSLYDTALCADPERLRFEAYSVFAAVNTPLLRIETDLRNAKHLLILTDSYGACMVPFFTQHYSSVTVVNTELALPQDWQRHMTQQPSQILLICSADTITAGQ